MEHAEIAGKDASSSFKLRLLQTTDLHMHLLAYDYDAMQGSTRIGLANLVPAITAYQADDVPTLLFDTGDFLQGNPLADATMRAPDEEPHPIVRAFNGLNYDAVALGNHDFDYGLPALKKITDRIACPVLCANAILDGCKNTYAPTTTLSVKLSEEKQIKIGVIGLITPVLDLLDSTGRNLLTATAPQTVAKKLAQDLRDEGADLVIALCHFGIDPEDQIENVAADIAAITHIDAVLAGHTHETFPAGNLHEADTIDQEKGCISETPTVMAGAYGQHLGVIEMELCVTDAKVTVTDFEASLETPRPQAAATPEIFAPIAALQEKTVAHVSAKIGQTALPLSTAFSLIQPDLTQYLLSCARQLHIQDLIAGSPYAKRPILTSAAPFRTGSRLNPADYIMLPPGPITRKDVAAIYPFNNPPIALRRNGAQIKDWLEDAALVFHMVTPGLNYQPLIDPRIPPYRFDTIFGLTYKIDVSARPGHRIVDIAYKGQAVADTDMFTLVTSTNRLSHGQNIPPEDIICIAQQSSQDVLAQALQNQSPITTPCPDVWRFQPIPNTKAQFYSSATANPSAANYRLQDDGITAEGFRQFTLPFDG